MQLILNALQAGGLFDVFVAHGNYDDREYAYTQHKKDEFIENCARGINEYWYSTKSGSSMKIYFDGFREQPVWAHMQTYNPLKEKTLQEDLNKALTEYVAAQRATA
jgi:hypothetical protein